MKHSLKHITLTLLFTCTIFLGLFSTGVNASNKTLTTGNSYYTYIYNKNGEKRTTYKGKSAHLTSPQTFSYKGDPKKIKKDYYYQIGKNAFIKTNDVGILDGKLLLN